MRILTQGAGLAGFHGLLGKDTKLSDAYGKPLHVGDVVIVLHDDNFENKVLADHESWGLEFICEDMNRKNNFYVMGIADTWTEAKLKLIDFNDDYWAKLKELTHGWVVVKVKGYEKLVEGERLGFLYVQTIVDATEDKSE